MFRVTLLAAVMTCEVLLGPTMAGDASQALRDADLRNGLYMTSEDARHRAYLEKEAYNAKAAMEANPPSILTSAQRQERFGRALDLAEAAYKERNWSNSSAETGLRAAIGVATVGGAAFAGSVGGPKAAMGVVKAGMTTDELLKKASAYVDRNLKSGETMSTDAIYAHNSVYDHYLINDPDLKPFENRFRVGVYGVPADKDPLVMQTRTNEKINDFGATLAKIGREQNRQDRVNQLAGVGLARQQKQLSGDVQGLKTDVAALKKEFEAEMPGLMQEMSESIKNFNSYVGFERGQRDLAVRRDNYTGAFVAFSSLASLTGDEKTAGDFNKIAVMSGAVFDLTHSLTSVSDQPFKYVNLYLLLATTALDLVNGAKENPEFAAIMKGLEQLSTQIEDLRKEMNQRFDRLELRQAHYFYETFLDLNRIEASQISLAKAVENLQMDLDALRVNVSDQFTDLAQGSILDLNTKCLAMGSKGPFKIQSEQVAGECFGKYLALAGGALNHVLPTDQVAINQARFADLVKTAAPLTRRSTSGPYDRRQFISGALKFAEVMKRNPEWAALGRDGHWDDDRQSFSLANLVAQGKEMRDFQENLALEQRGDGYHLRRDLIQKYLDAYLDQAQKVAATAVSVYPAPLREWPDPGLKWKTPGPNAPPASAFPFVHQKVPLCQVPQPTTITLSRHDRGRPFDGDDGPRQRNLVRYDPNFMQLNEQFLKFLPDSVRWGDFLNTKAFKSFGVSACMTRVDIFDVSVYRPDKRWRNFGPSDVGVTFGLDVNVDYELGDGSKRHLVVAHLDASRHDPTPFFDPQYGPGISAMAWAGMTGDDTHGNNPAIFRNPNNSLGLANEAGHNFKEAVTGEIMKNREIFENDFSAVIDARKPGVFQEAARATRQDLAQLDSIRWQLLYLLRHGLDLGHEGAATLYQRLAKKDLMTGDAFLHWAVDVSPNQALEQLRKDFADVALELQVLDEARDLRPAISPLEPYIEMLQAWQVEPAKAVVADQPANPVATQPKIRVRRRP